MVLILNFKRQLTYSRFSRTWLNSFIWVSGLILMFGIYVISSLEYNIYSSDRRPGFLWHLPLLHHYNGSAGVVPAIEILFGAKSLTGFWSETSFRALETWMRYQLCCCDAVRQTYNDDAHTIFFYLSDSHFE